jgi:ABC-type Fe3+-hydroxamate transport system substrate-binding protein
MLHWNAKPNGDNVLNRVAELLTEQVQNITILKDWELIPEVAVNSGTPERSAENMAKIAEYKPDLVIGSQCD